jgi:hypothetical protein
MKASLRFWGVLASGALAVSCMGEAMMESGLEGNSNDPYTPCTDALKCCPKSEMVCHGDPDTGVVCKCASLWDCSKNPKKCEQDKQVPSGKGAWDCKWTKDTYTCTGTPGAGEVPGGKGWTCKKNGNDWKCEKDTVPNPSNKPDGGNYWDCEVDNELNKLKCEKKSTPPPSTPPVTPPSTPPPSTPPSTPPSNPPPPIPPPAKECKPGTKMWCDGLQYCGWGQVVCGPKGYWKRTGFLGLGGLDCQELPDGRRPNTKCACYHTFFNKKCCETKDCIVPAGTNGQICPKSAGKLCDFCNPLKPECTNGKCVVTNSNETYCGQSCSSSNNCPQGYMCMSMKVKGGSTMQCVPTDYSCFN